MVLTKATVIGLSLVLVTSLFVLNMGAVSASYVIQEPSHPRNITSNTNIFFLSLEWSPPLYDGGSPISYYLVEGWAGDPVNWTWESRAYSTYQGFLSPRSQSELVGGWEYHFNVSAVNMAGRIGPRAEITVKPIFAPIAPTDLTATPGTGFINLSWSAPVEDGGSPVTGYTIYRNQYGGSPVMQNFNLTATSYNDTQVDCGVTYSYEIKSVNAVGESFFGTYITIVPGAPSPPIGLHASSSTDSTELAWSPPLTEGASPVTEYRIIRLYDGQIATVPAPTTWYNDTDISGDMHEYYVTAVNALGESGQSGTIWAPMRAPEPVPLVATQGNGHINISWPYQYSPGSPPGDGASPITSYEVTRYEYEEASGRNHSWLNTSVTTPFYNDSSVINGVDYFYRVVAINSVGKSEESIIEIVPGRPSSPLSGDLSHGGGFINITWFPPVSDGGAPLTSYEIYRNGYAFDSEPYAIIAPSSTWFNDTEIHEGDYYFYTVYASNANGQSDWGLWVQSLYVPGPPPIDLEANAGIGYVNLTWSPPSIEGIFGYSIIRLIENRTDAVTIIYWPWNDPHYNDTTANGLVNGLAYNYYVSALTPSGDSAPSDLVTAQPGGPDLVLVGPIQVLSGGLDVDSVCVGELVTVHFALENKGFYSVFGAKVLLKAHDGTEDKNIAVVIRDSLPGQILDIEVLWRVNASYDGLILEAIVDPWGAVTELDEENNTIAHLLNIYTPIIIVEPDEQTYKSGDDIMVSGNIHSPTSLQPLTYLAVKIELVDSGGATVGEEQYQTTNSTGGFVCIVHIPDEVDSGTYQVKATTSIGSLSFSNISMGVGIEATEGFEIDLILIIAVAIAIGVVITFIVVMIRRKGK